MWKKVVAPVFLVSFFWILFSGGTTYYRRELLEYRGRVLTENMSSIRASGEMLEFLWKMEATFLNLLDDKAPSGRDAVAEIEADFEQSLLAAEQAAFTEAEKPLARSIRELFQEYRDYVDQSLAQLPESQLQSDATAQRSAQLAHSVAKPCSKLLRLNEELMAQAVETRSNLEDALNTIRLIFLVIGPMVGIFIGMRIATSLQHSISQISVTLRDASGELDQEVGRVEVSPTFDDGDLSALNHQVQLISTRIRQIVTELQVSRQKTVVAERLAVVGELAAGVAHEIRNPLTAVKLLVQTAPKRNAECVLNERHVEVILQEVSRMEETIQGLLDYAGPPRTNRVRHDLCDTIHRALNLVEGRALHAGVAVVSRLAPDPLPIDADPEQIHQVFVNLLINGIESMPSAGTLEVSAGVCDGDRGRCVVIVADHGVGIPSDRLSRIFDPFVTTKERGTGLGLAVSRRIVQEHGGTITASNRPDGGTIFSVELPLDRSCSSHKNDPHYRHQLVVRTGEVGDEPPKSEE
jgi:signal transduction histidine kinase